MNANFPLVSDERSAGGGVNVNVTKKKNCSNAKHTHTHKEQNEQNEHVFSLFFYVHVCKKLYKISMKDEHEITEWGGLLLFPVMVSTQQLFVSLTIIFVPNSNMVK